MFTEGYKIYRSKGVPLAFELFNAKLTALQRSVFSLMGLLIMFAGIVLILSSMDDLTNETKIWVISIGYAFLAGGVAFVINSFVKRRTVVGNLEIFEKGIQLTLNNESNFINYSDINSIVYCNGMLNNYFLPSTNDRQKLRSNVYSQIFWIELANGTAYLIESNVTISRRLLYIIYIPIVELSKVLKLAIGEDKVVMSRREVRKKMKKYPMNQLISIENSSTNF